MSTYTDTKYKACPPEETVERIKGILHRIGIETNEEWIESGIGTVSSVRITMKGSNIGQNGKGTNRAYALASGYAEFMERLQTGLLYQFDRDTLSDLMGVKAAFPDEEIMDISDAASAGGTLLEETLRQIHISDGRLGFLAPPVEEALRAWLDASDRLNKGRFVMLPYENLFTGEREWMAEEVWRSYYFTNGSCAGNTREEALVQGLSEIAERFATDRIMTKRLTPPEVPREVLQTVEPLWELISQVRQFDRFALRIVDASCGMGLPVVGAILTDRVSGKIIIRFGAYPRFETALERCLTEMLQGRHIEHLEHSPSFDLTRDDETAGYENRFNFAKAACGMFPSQIICGEESWQYSDCFNKDETVHGHYEFMLKLFEKLSFTPYVRDCSFLGFPTYHIIVPGKSMVFDFGSQRLREKKQHYAVRYLLRDLRKATTVERNDVLDYVLKKRGWMLENSFGYLAGIPCDPLLEDVPVGANVIAALILMKENDFGSAAGMLKELAYDEKGNVTFAMPLAQAVLLTQRKRSVSAGALDAVYGDDRGQKAMDIIKDPMAALPELHCPDCALCPYVKCCEVYDVSSAFRKFYEAVSSCS